MELEIKRGEIYYANLCSMEGLIGGIRPVIILQNEVANKYSSICTVIPISTNLSSHKLPTHIKLDMHTGLTKNSIAICELIMPISKNKLLEKIGMISTKDIVKIETATMLTLGINFKENIMLRKEQEYNNSNIDINSKEKNDNIEVESEDEYSLTKEYEVGLQDIHKLVKCHYDEYKEANSSKNKWKERIVGGIIGAIISGFLSLIV